jgi:thiamine biosynthesis lipoprotein
MRPAPTLPAPFALAALTALAAFAVSTACSAPTPASSPQLIERAWMTMGSELKVMAWVSDTAATEQAFEEVFREFERLDGLLSVWREGSDVNRINAAAGRAAVPVHPEVREILATARQISEWTGGKFDVTFGALADVWKFDHDQDNSIPDEAAIQERLLLVDYTGVVVDDRAGTVSLARRGMRIHLGGIGKGYAVDRAVGILRRRGIRDFIVQSGGDLYAGGARGGTPWRLGINDPRGAPGESFGTVELSDATFSTSGDYERFFMKGNIRYHHLLDPDIGQPARECRSVTIVADRAIVADGLSTGVFIMGPAAGMALIEKLPRVEGVIVRAANNEVLVSTGLRRRFVLLAAPTDAP